MIIIIEYRKHKNKEEHKKCNNNKVLNRWKDGAGK